MLRALLILLLLAGGACAAVAFVPLKTAMDFAHLDKVGLTPYATPGFDPGPATPAGPVELPMPTMPPAPSPSTAREGAR